MVGAKPVGDVQGAPRVRAHSKAERAREAPRFDVGEWQRLDFEESERLEAAGYERLSSSEQAPVRAFLIRRPLKDLLISLPTGTWAPTWLMLVFRLRMPFHRLVGGPHDNPRRFTMRHGVAVNPRVEPAYRKLRRLLKRCQADPGLAAAVETVARLSGAEGLVPLTRKEHRCARCRAPLPPGPSGSNGAPC